MNLIYFLLGALFVAIGIPVLQGLVDLISGLVQMALSKMGVYISKKNEEVENMKTEDQNMKSIGFQLPVIEENGDDDTD